MTSKRRKNRLRRRKRYQLVRSVRKLEARARGLLIRRRRATIKSFGARAERCAEEMTRFGRSLSAVARSITANIICIDDRVG